LFERNSPGNFFRQKFHPARTQIIDFPLVLCAEGTTSDKYERRARFFRRRAKNSLAGAGN